MVTKIKAKEEYWIGFNEYKTGRRLNISYTNKFEGFLKHVDATSYLILDEGGYCTATNIKHFFQNVVGKKTDCLRSSLIKYRQAINKFATTLEDRGHDFNCEDFDGVVQALNQGSDNNKKHKLANPEDHHKKDPTRVISELDEVKLMESALGCLYGSVFHSFFVGWNVLCRTWVRSKSLINIYWKDVGIMHPSYLPYPNFPENNPVNFGVTFFLTVSKQTSRLTVVGSWRHKHVLLCPVSAISFYVIMFLIKDCANDWDNFFKPEGWVGTKCFTSKFLLLRLVSWKSREELADVIVKQQLHARTPPRVKTTHCRLDALLRAFMIGCRREDASILSKHKTNRIDDYLPQLPKNAMHTSAGRMLSPHKEVFFVERAHLFMEAELEAKLAQLLLPFLTTFEDQLCAMGKSAVESEVIFIRKLLPMYAKTALQDGVYYITYHPTCRISLFMIDVLGDAYINYCHHASKMSIVLEYLYSSSMYCYREESFVDGSFLFKDMNKSTPLECMPIHVRACVDPSNPAASPKLRPYLHKLKAMLCQLDTSPLMDMSRFTTYPPQAVFTSPSAFLNSPTYRGACNPPPLQHKYNPHGSPVRNLNAVASPSLPPQSNAASSALGFGRGRFSSRYSPGIGLARRLFDASPVESPGTIPAPPTLGALQIPTTFPKKMMEVIRQHHANRLYVAKHHYGLNDYGIRSSAAKITFRHRTFIWLACEKKCGVSNGELHMKAMEAAAVLLEQSTPLTPSNYARAHSTKLKLRGKHAPRTLFK
jgi:hypothetical protein